MQTQDFPRVQWLLQGSLWLSDYLGRSVDPIVDLEQLPLATLRHHFQVDR
ncbi:hypothetical protein XM38_012150 [Halomicronema hongdechloris C2206]|uniref:Uncharacterized protein n=1 Tax=Halomicronema hongdechloris C2206 TaxID=1641165 RepID=A0A1Z3HJ00_9CYAN|nr:hypothetical protein [Halomicronema hongdechloris]ASC70278.1 hypothetical protein XM38_012150 [Halomicronema hongdechloris C2206]